MQHHCKMGKMENILLLLLMLTCCVEHSNGQIKTAKEFIDWYNANIGELSYDSGNLAFIKATNLTDYNTKQSEKASVENSKLYSLIRQNASTYSLDGVDADTKRQYKLLLMTRTSKNESIVKKISEIGGKMETLYSTGKVTYDKNIIKSITKNTTTMTLGDLVNIMKTSNDSKELLYVWKGWRDTLANKLKGLYKEYVHLNNIGAVENHYEDAGDYKRKIYEVNNLKEVAEEFWKELKPFYQEVHAYVRHRLTHVYPDLVKDTEPIPAHLLGNMWAQSWDNVYKHVIPFREEPKLDVTPALKKNYTVKQMFEKAEEFFVSIGWPKLPAGFWKKTLFVKPKDREVVCHASAWDFGVNTTDGPDVRVKMCTEKDQDNFITIHHELGHIYYYLLYWNQPSEYRTGANPGFHEAVGDTIVLSVQTPKHLKEIGLIDSVSTTNEADINFLLKTAMERIAFLPFGYLMDQWMWGVYSGDIKPEEYNKKWWEMRLKYQGIKPPVNRTENDFDPGAKYHIPADTPYIRYFFAHILQFTFHKHACRHANVKGPLHKCSIYNSTEAGKALGDMLRLGKKKPWPEALKQFTGSDKLSAAPINEYFKPLIDWLKKERAEKKYKLGWDKEKKNNTSFGQNVYSSLFLTIAGLILVFGVLH
ncbi:angiotensin-converting enzyme-like [Hydractinia symbiolongicarpus]|uniref:angiotensin-converting enzyme-like n=1 Tax=Hydractinia symbiolongicarpus TaxID=13093 RepID=UPI00254C936A|nr:angiotensin-converting enzyme-like [Hydractinia symbiolongicarpus]